MASPFSIFRKHQRVMLAGVTILAMIGFVFVGPWSGRSGSGVGGNAKGTEVANWKFGAIYSADVQNRRSSRREINAFFEGAYKELAAKGKVSDGTPIPSSPSTKKTAPLTRETP